MDDTQRELDALVKEQLNLMNMGMDEKQRTLRKSLCTGTKVAKILGRSKFGTEYDVYARCKGLIEDTPPTEAMLRGTVLEVAILNFYEQKCGVVLERPHGTMIHPTEDWAGASPDGFFQDDDGTIVIVDAKTSRNRSEWGKEFSDDMPIDYQLQLLWYAYVVGNVLDCPVKRLDVHVYFPIQDEFAIYTMKPDQEVIEKMVERCRQWWWRHIVANNAPAIDGSDSATKVINLTPKYNDDVVQTDEEGADLIERLIAIKSQLKEIEKEKKGLENQIKDLINHNEGIYYGARKATWKEQKGRSSWDTKQLEADHPELAEKYKKSGKSFRVLRVK